MRFSDYYWAFLKRFWQDSKPWARDNILWGVFVLIVPPIAAYWRLHGKYAVDWELLKTTLYLYGIVLAIYLFVHLVRTPWKLNQGHVDRHGEHREAELTLKAEICDLRAKLQNAEAEVADQGPRMYLEYSLPSTASKYHDLSRASSGEYGKNLGSHRFADCKT